MTIYTLVNIWVSLKLAVSFLSIFVNFIYFGTEVLKH